MGKTVRMMMWDRPVRAQTRDALLTAEDPNNPSPNPIKRIDVGKIWGGVLEALTAIKSDEDRAQAVEMIGSSLSAFAKSTGCPGWETDALGHTATPTTDQRVYASDTNRRISQHIDAMDKIAANNRALAKEIWKL